MFKTYTLTVSSGLGVGSFSQSWGLGLPLGSSEPRLRAKVGRQHIPPEGNTRGPRGVAAVVRDPSYTPGAAAATGVKLLSPSLQQKHFFSSLKNGRLISC